MKLTQATAMKTAPTAGKSTKACQGIFYRDCGIVQSSRVIDLMQTLRGILEAHSCRVEALRFEASADPLTVLVVLPVLRIGQCFQEGLVAPGASYVLGRADSLVFGSL